MSAAIAIPGSTASTFLTHFFRSGLADDIQVVERFRTMVDGDIRCCAGEPPVAKKGRRPTSGPGPGQTRRTRCMSMRPGAAASMARSFSRTSAERCRSTAIPATAGWAARAGR